jgi:signal transduction histidine kinase
VQVTLEFQPDRLGVAVENGEGTPGPNGHGAGVGIMGMSERATSVGGTVAVRQLGHGYRVEAELPYALP